jgi:lycopene beta-cyclase
MKKYEYKMIRGIDFFEHVLSKVNKFENVVFIYDTLEHIHRADECVLAKTVTSEYKAKFVFNSTRFDAPKFESSNPLLQHFEGWVIRLKESFFDEKKATLMDFSVS